MAVLRISLTTCRARRKPSLLISSRPAEEEQSSAGPTSYHLLPQGVGERRGGQLFPEPSSVKAGSVRTGLIILGLVLKAPFISEPSLSCVIGSLHLPIT